MGKDQAGEFLRKAAEAEKNVKWATDPDVRQRMAELGQEIPPREQQGPQALGLYQRAEIGKWWPIIKAADIRSE